MGSIESIEQLQPGAKRLPRINQGGNFCGHDPCAPTYKAIIKRLSSEASHPLLRTAIISIGKYYQDPGMLKSIDKILASGDNRKKRRDGKHRKTRSERRDAIAMVTAYFLSQLNLMKLQVGTVPYSDFNGLLAETYEQIAGKLAMSQIRVKRACQHLKNAGYITISPRRIKQPDGSYKSLGAIIRVQDCIFGLLGISKEWLERARQHQYQKWKKERNRRFQKAVTKQTEKKRAESQADYLFFKAQLTEDNLLKEIMDTVSRFPSKARKRRQSEKPKYHS